MKLRLRSMDAEAPRGGPVTHRVDVQSTDTLADVRALVAAKLFAAQPVPAESVRFSLNRSEELVSQDPAATLLQLGLASGDLVYFTLSPLWVPAPPAQAPPPNPSRASASIAKAADRGKSPQQSGAGGFSSQMHAMDANPSVPMASDPADVVMVDAIDPAKTWSSFVLRDLKREMENVVGAGGTVIGLLIAALHAALLDVGFRTSDPMGPHLTLPQDWPSGTCAPLIIKYTVPEFVAMLPVAEEGKVAMLNFSLMGNFITVYGYVPGKMPRLCLELQRLEPLLYLDSDQLSQVQERGIIELWRVLKDEMCLPLMISLCQLNGLQLPPCLMTLPADLKTKILEFLPGEDLASVECTCKEMRILAADGNLWKKFTSKAKFADVWTAKKRRQKRPSPSFWNYGWGNPPFVPHRFPVIGGDSDRLPFHWNHGGSSGRIFGNQRRNVLPNCNLNDGRRSFFDNFP